MKSFAPPEKILVTPLSLPVRGPVAEQSRSLQLPKLEQSFKLIAYDDDVKLSILSLHEFDIVDHGCPASGKVKTCHLANGKDSFNKKIFLISI